MTSTSTMIDQAIAPTLENITTSTHLPAASLSGDLHFVVNLFAFPLALLACAGIFMGLLLLFIACTFAATGISVWAIRLTERYILSRVRACPKHEDKERATICFAAIGYAYFIIMFAILVIGGWKNLTLTRFALLGPAVLASELIVALTLIILVGMAQILGLVDRIRKQNERNRVAALKRDEDHKAAKKEDGSSDGESQTELVEV